MRLRSRGALEEDEGTEERENRALLRQLKARVEEDKNVSRGIVSRIKG